MLELPKMNKLILITDEDIEVALADALELEAFRFVGGEEFADPIGRGLRNPSCDW